MLHTRQLEIFWAVMRTGSMTEAGKLLGVSQPAVSRFIRHMEDQMGMELFERQNGRVQATAEAELLFPLIDEIFESIEFVSRTAADLRDVLSGRIKILAIATLAADLMPSAISSFVRDRPDVSVGLKVLPPKLVIERVVRQRFNIGLLYEPVSDSALAVHDLCATEIVAVVPAGHRLAGNPEITPEDLADERIICATPISPCGRLVDEAFSSRGVKKRAVVECNYSRISYSLVAAGTGIAVVEPVLGADVPSAGVVVKPFRPLVEIRPRVIYSKERPLSRLNAAFIAQLAFSSANLALTRPIPPAAPAARRSGPTKAQPTGNIPLAKALDRAPSGSMKIKHIRTGEPI